MKTPWTGACAAEIGADWLEEEIAPAGDFGRRAREREAYFLPGNENRAREAIAVVQAAANGLPAHALASLRGIIADCPNPMSALTRALGGATLDDADLFDLCRFLDALREVRGLAELPELRVVGLPPWPENLALLLEKGRTSKRTFYVSDEFDAELAAARAEAAMLRSRYDAERSRLRRRIAVYAGEEDVHDPEFVLMRERAPAPLPAEVRVLREAATYFLCEIALDEPARMALGRLETANARVAEKEDFVRIRLSAEVREAGPVLQQAVDALGALDAFVARARFAQAHDTCVPEIVDTASISFAEARLLPLERSLVARGHRYEALSLTLEAAGVLTGPNMGGKTAALRTVGFVACCVALGVPVPASAARLGLFDRIAWIGMGAEAEGAALLSSFGREVSQLRDFLHSGCRRPLVLVDEFARTTSPREGRALLVALVERLNQQGAVGLVATHLSRIAQDAGAPLYAIVGLREPPERSLEPMDLDAAVESIAAVMDYRVRRVASDEDVRADAIALADVLGLDASLIERARSAL